MRCAECRFYEPDEEMAPFNDQIGLCRRFPPQLSGSSARTMWPQVRAKEWCGEFQRIPPVDKVALAKKRSAA